MSESRSLLTSIVGHGIAESWIERILSESKGNPGVLKTLASLATTRTDGRASGAPLYELVPEDDADQESLVKLARPVVVSANEAMIAALKKQP
jgi:hypothetical protein